MGAGMADMGADGYHYQPGFGNEFVSEAVPGALPAGGRNSPQRAPLGLYAEQLSGTRVHAAAGRSTGGPGRYRIIAVRRPPPVRADR